MAASNCGKGFSPKDLANVLSSREYIERKRRHFCAWFCNLDFWTRESARVCENWFKAYPEALSVKSTPAYSTLLEIASNHMRLVLWPSLVDSNIMWRIDRSSAAPKPLNHALHHLFSMSGKTPVEGTLVYPCGPNLMGREPWEVQKRGGASHSSANQFDLSEFRGARCREIVVV